MTVAVAVVAVAVMAVAAAAVLGAGRGQSVSLASPTDPSGFASKVRRCNARKALFRKVCCPSIASLSVFQAVLSHPRHAPASPSRSPRHDCTAVWLRWCEVCPFSLRVTAPG